jgi:threonyl-tRNA synthetase
VRQFAQDDCHVFLREDQIADEVKFLMDFILGYYEAFGLTATLKFATRPETRIGDDAMWDRAEGALKAALEQTGLAWELKPGDGAFYGPKIDFDVSDSIGRKWQLGTIQLDYAAPERFDLTYAGEDNTEHRPVVIHRAIYGSFERFIAILVEHFAGNFPVWLAPVQARVVTVADRHQEWGREATARLAARGLRVELDESNDKLGAKIRLAQLAKIPYTLVIGDNEVAAKSVSPRKHGEGKEADLGIQPLDAFAEKLVAEAAVPY